MNTAVPSQGPGGNPVWCHHHCFKMRAEELNLDRQILVIKGSAAKVTLQRKPTEVWFVDWRINHARGHVNGHSELSDWDIEAAFGIPSKGDPCRYSGWLIEQFGADVAGQGRYIRQGSFLNIPCPGTGHDGDPNVSIYLTEEIREAIRQLLSLE